MITWNIALLIVGLFTLIKSSKWVVKYIISIADFLNISDYIVAFLIMSFATTLPELVVGVNAAINNTPAIALGNAFGSIIANMGLVLGLTIIITGPIKAVGKADKYHIWPVFILSMSPILLLVDGLLSKTDGYILLALFFGYCFYLIFSKSHIKEKDVFSEVRSFIDKKNSLLKELKNFLVAIAVLLGSAYIIVNSAQAISTSLGVSELLIGAVIIALGTSLPELTFAIRSSSSNHSGLSLGNIIGASAFNSTLILGIVAIINPILIPTADSKIFFLTAGTMFLLLFLSNLFLSTKNSITRLEGSILFLLYLAFIVLSVLIYQ